MANSRKNQDVLLHGGKVDRKRGVQQRDRQMLVNSMPVSRCVYAHALCDIEILLFEAVRVCVAGNLLW
jgi:hypothetical protein